MKHGPTVMLLLAAAQSDELAKGHCLAGRAYYKQARYAEAIREFEEAYRLSTKPGLLYNLAQACERVGELDKAVAHLKRLLAAGARFHDPTAIRERIHNLEEQLARTGMRMVSSEDGARVYVDDKPAGKTPIAGPIRLPPGSHQIRVSKEGFHLFTAFISVTSGNLVQVTARLLPGPSGPGPRPSPRQRHGYVWTWAAAGTSAALLVTCDITGGVALKKAGDAGSPPAQDEGTADSARRLALASGIRLGAAVAATVLFFLERKLGREPVSATVAPVVGPRSVALHAAWSF